jgi:hypothetical protein
MAWLLNRSEKEQYVIQLKSADIVAGSEGFVTITALKVGF